MKLPMPFQKWTTYEDHDGVDFPMPKGTPIPASGWGRIVQVDWSERGGWRAWVEYDTGELVKYCHMDAKSHIRPIGTRLTPNETLAWVGMLGKGSTGYHVHVENGRESGEAGVWKIFDSQLWVGGTINATQEDNMFKVCKLNNGDIFVVGPKKITHLGGMDDVVASEQLYGPMVDEHKSRLHMIFCDVPFGDARKHVNKTYA